MERLCDIKSLRELRKVRRENESTMYVIKKRIHGNVLNLFPVERYFSIEKLFEFIWRKNGR